MQVIKKRPAIIVSHNIRNELSRTVLIVPFTSNLESGETPTRVLVLAGESGLEINSLALCDQVSTVLKSYLGGEPFGTLNSDLLARIQQGIQIAIGVY